MAAAIPWGSVQRAVQHGYHWANIDGNYVLIAAATGVITALVLNSALN